MEIAVADMPGDRSQQAARGDVALTVGHALGEAGYRHADVGRDRLRPGPQPARRKIGIMARLPQARAIFRPRRPIKRTAAELRCNLAKPFGLFRDAGRTAVELDE